MFVNIALTSFIVSASILCGALSVDYMINSSDNFGSFTIGGWRAYPQVGTKKTDPYTRARTAKRGDISLGRAEGLVFQIWKDNRGRPLYSHCNYLLKGHIPKARLFTLYTADKLLKPYTSSSKLPFELHTDNIVYESDGSFHIYISKEPQAGNWLAIISKKKFGLILTLYDTSIISATILQKPTMPSVKQIPSGQRNCD
ncbi:DUF1214 domain-containing protein [Bartonella sp. CB178]|uniref:DUF1214 domain-containing protein n=1 Tax=Bartonella sp. CB178 TaxID=3112255 RepID=UPI00300E52BA